MTEPRSDDRSQARREAAALLGIDIDHLSPADGLRVDMVSALRLVIDHEQASVLSGSSADLGKLNVAVSSLIALLPGRELPAPEANRPGDDHEAIAPLLKLFRYLHEQVHTLTAENAQLRGRLGLPSAVTTKNAITPPTADIVPACERASMDAGPQPGPDDWRAPRPGPVIDGKVNAPAASEQGWDATPNGKAWRDWHDAGGSVGGDRWSNRNIP